MTDCEEPAAKILKIDVAPKDMDLDEGQEEWLSEGILTDDDYNPAADRDKSDINVNTSQGDTTPSIAEDDIQEPIGAKEQDQAENIEKTLDNFEKTQPPKIPDELGAFLIRKTDSKAIEEKKDASEIDEPPKPSDDDGNDTDELLRMLGEDGQKSKKAVKKLEQKRSHDSQSTDDDEYIFEGAKVARLKVAKNVLLKKYPSKAVPENTSDTDMSSDEATVKKVFVTRRPGNFASKSTTKPPGVRAAGVKAAGVNTMTNVTNKIVTVKKPGQEKPSKKPSPLQQPQTELSFGKFGKGTPILSKMVTVRNAPKKVAVPVKLRDRTTESLKVIVKESPKRRTEPDEIINEEEFLEEEEEFDLDEDFESEPEREGKQRIMKPEQMDEEVPTDGDSHSDDDDSLYDEFPSSESDQDEWFTLDVRSERAGDYIPLLGSKAHHLLVAEKQRVTARLSTLRLNLSTLNESSQQQTEMLRRATLQLAELDAALKA